MTFSREKFRRVSAQNGGLSDFIDVAAAHMGDKEALEALQEELLNSWKGKSVLMPWQKTEAVKMAQRGETPTLDSVRVHKRLDIETAEVKKRIIDIMQLKPDTALQITLSGSARSAIQRALIQPEQGFINLRKIFNEKVTEPLARMLQDRKEMEKYIRENDDTTIDILRTDTDGEADFQLEYQSPTWHVRQEAKRQKWEEFLKNGMRLPRAIEAPEKASFRPKSRLG